MPVPSRISAPSNLTVITTPQGSPNPQQHPNPQQAMQQSQSGCGVHDCLSQGRCGGPPLTCRARPCHLQHSGQCASGGRCHGDTQTRMQTCRDPHMPPEDLLSAISAHFTPHTALTQGGRSAPAPSATSPANPTGQAALPNSPALGITRDYHLTNGIDNRILSPHAPPAYYRVTERGPHSALTPQTWHDGNSAESPLIQLMHSLGGVHWIKAWVSLNDENFWVYYKRGREDDSLDPRSVHRLDGNLPVWLKLTDLNPPTQILTFQFVGLHEAPSVEERYSERLRRAP